LEDKLKAEEKYQEIAMLRFSRGRSSGINLVLNSLRNDTEFMHIPERNEIIINGNAKSLLDSHNELLKYLINKESEYLSQDDNIVGPVTITDEEIGKNAWDHTVVYSVVGYHMLGLKAQLAIENEPQFIQKEEGIGWSFSSNPGRYNPGKLAHHRREYEPNTGEFLNGNKSGYLRGKHKKTVDIYYANLGGKIKSQAVADELWGMNSEITYLRRMISSLRLKMDMVGQPSLFEGSLKRDYKLNLNPLYLL